MIPFLSTMKTARSVMPSLPVSVIYDVFTLRNVKSYRARGYQNVSLRMKTVNEKLVSACHEQGIKVYVWTVDQEDEIRKVVSWGVDGIYSNEPAALRNVLESSASGVRS